MISYILEVYLVQEDGEILTIRSKYQVTEELTEEHAIALATKVAKQYNSKGHSYCIFKEEIKPIKYILNEYVQNNL